MEGLTCWSTTPEFPCVLLFEEVNLDVVRKVMDINFYGVLLCHQSCLAEIMKSKGSIIGISSVAGYRGFRSNGVLGFKIRLERFPGSSSNRNAEQGRAYSDSVPRILPLPIFANGRWSRTDRYKGNHRAMNAPWWVRRNAADIYRATGEAEKNNHSYDTGKNSPCFWINGFPDGWTGSFTMWWRRRPTPRFTDSLTFLFRNTNLMLSALLNAFVELDQLIVGFGWKLAFLHNDLSRKNDPTLIDSKRRFILAKSGL